MFKFVKQEFFSYFFDRPPVTLQQQISKKYTAKIFNTRDSYSKEDYPPLIK